MVNDAAGEYVKDHGETHTQSVESFFAIMKRGVMGSFHSISEQHLQRYVDECLPMEHSLIARHRRHGGEAWSLSDWIGRCHRVSTLSGLLKAFTWRRPMHLCFAAADSAMARTGSVRCARSGPCAEFTDVRRRLQPGPRSLHMIDDDVIERANTAPAEWIDRDRSMGAT